MGPKEIIVVLHLSIGQSIQRLILSKWAKYIKCLSENVSSPIIIVLRISSLISKDQNENIICTMDDARVGFLGPPHGTTPAEVPETKN